MTKEKLLELSGDLKSDSATQTRAYSHLGHGHAHSCWARCGLRRCCMLACYSRGCGSACRSSTLLCCTGANRGATDRQACWFFAGEPAGRPKIVMRGRMPSPDVVWLWRNTAPRFEATRDHSRWRRLTDAGQNGPLAILMRAGGNWREPSVLPAASSCLCLDLTGNDSSRLTLAKLIPRWPLKRTALP
jgi:hypothetical protein